MKVSGTELYNAILALLDNFTKEEALHRILSFVTEEQYRTILKHLVDTSRFETELVNTPNEQKCQCNGDCTCNNEPTETEVTESEEDINLGDLVKIGRVQSVRSIPPALQNKTVAELLLSVEDDEEYNKVLEIAKGLNCF